MHYEYRTHGTCSTRIDLDIEDGIVQNVTYTGGCNGNLQGISRKFHEKLADTFVSASFLFTVRQKRSSAPGRVFGSSDSAPRTLP